MSLITSNPSVGEMIIPAHALHSGRTVGKNFEKINRCNTPIA